MIKILQFLLVTLVFKPSLIYACDCSPIVDYKQVLQASFRENSHVFTGVVIEINNEFWIEVNEVFKGDLKGCQLIRTQSNYSSCSFSFNKEGFGLFYGDFYKNNFHSNICGLTRLYNSPIVIPPSPPRPGIEVDTLKHHMDYKIHQEKEQLRFCQEIITLKAMSRKN
jgi:hypothetical protein